MGRRFKARAFHWRRGPGSRTAGWGRPARGRPDPATAGRAQPMGALACNSSSSAAPVEALAIGAPPCRRAAPGCGWYACAAIFPPEAWSGCCSPWRAPRPARRRMKCRCCEKTWSSHWPEPAAMQLIRPWPRLGGDSRGLQPLAGRCRTARLGPWGQRVSGLWPPDATGLPEWLPGQEGAGRRAGWCTRSALHRGCSQRCLQQADAGGAAGQLRALACRKGPRGGRWRTAPAGHGRPAGGR